MDDVDFIENLVEGDEGAYYKLIEEHKNMVKSVALKIVKDNDTAEDIAQETFITVFEKIHTFEGRSKLSTWIYRIAYNKSLESFRKKKAKVSYEEVAYLKELADETPTPEETTMSKSTVREVREKLDELPEKYRLPLTLYYLSDKSYKDVSEIMDIPIGSVKTYLHRGKKELLKLMRREDVLL